MFHNKTVHDLLSIKEIYLEPSVKNYKRGQDILSKYSNAELKEVKSHRTIPELIGFGGSVEFWISNKKMFSSSV